MRRQAARPNRGDTLIGVLIGGVLIAVLLTAFYRVSALQRRDAQATTQRLAADFYTAELLEFFRSQTPRRLVTLLRANFTTAAVAPAAAFPLCAHINILNRATGALVNQAALATLPASWLDWPATANIAGVGFSLAANRFFQVFVIDITTLRIVPAWCTRTGFNITIAGPAIPPLVQLGANERFMVLVGVSFVPKLKAAATLDATDADRVAGSVILPGPYL